MAVLLGKIFEGYDLLFNEWSDPRTASWPLIGSPIPIAVILGVYLYFVNNLGPRLMKDRKPFQLRELMLLYNAGQVFICSYVVYKSFELAWGGHYRLVCEPIDYSYDKRAMEIAGCVNLYMYIKLTDLLDTVFFVFRKKNSHITFLHVYHHTGMVVLTWSSTKYLAGGHGTLLGVINSVVHVVMYAYYFLTLVNDKYKKSIWWKKHITQIQIVQFLMLVLHFSVLVVTPDCAYPRWVAAVVVPQNLFMMLLFLDFYRKAYLKPVKAVTENGTAKEDSPITENGAAKRARNGKNSLNDLTNNVEGDKIDENDVTANGVHSLKDKKLKVN